MRRIPVVRNALGSVVALIGAAAAVWSPFRAWYDGRHGRDYRVQDLFNGITGTHAELMGSVFLPMLFVGLVTLVGLLLRSRLLITLAGLVTLAFTVLWMVRQGQAAGDLTVNTDGNGLNMGVAIALGGGVLLLLAAVLMSGRRGLHRRRRRAPEPEPVRREPEPYGQRPGPYEGAYERPPEGSYTDPYERPRDEARLGEGQRGEPPYGEGRHEEAPYGDRQREEAPYGPYGEQPNSGPPTRAHGASRDRGADETQELDHLDQRDRGGRPPAAEDTWPAPPPRDGR
ncbi:hypothetical protein AB0A77_09005 [Streptomyces varsoviensis]|uniref:hypothetical protein n=1 Tax=Streptomyces varsoviensis TaxID=67373 RepID=UPI0033D71047